MKTSSSIAVRNRLHACKQNRSRKRGSQHVELFFLNHYFSDSLVTWKLHPLILPWPAASLAKSRDLFNASKSLENDEKLNPHFTDDLAAALPVWKYMAPHQFHWTHRKCLLLLKKSFFNPHKRNHVDQRDAPIVAFVYSNVLETNHAHVFDEIIFRMEEQGFTGKKRRSC